MTNIATVSDEELQHTREIYADLVAEGRELDPASELDRMHARGIFPFALELIDEVLRQRKWAREMVEMAASGGRLDGYRELADELAAKDGEIERLTDENGRLRADLLAGRNVVNAGLTIHTLTIERDMLRQEIERLTAALRAQPGPVSLDDVEWAGKVHLAEAIRERDELRRQLAEAELDAERYRWLRKIARQNTAYDVYKDGAHWSVGLHSDDRRQTFDQAIDAAMGLTRQTEES